MIRPIAFSSLLLLLLASSLDAADGSRLYTECAKCHGIRGEKSEFSRAIGGWSRGEIKKALKEYRAGKRNLRGQGSIMRQRVADFSDAQIDAVAAYVSGLK